MTILIAIAIAVLLSFIYVWNKQSKQSKQLTDEEITDIMSKGFIDGVTENSKDYMDVSAKKAIADMMKEMDDTPLETVTPSIPSMPLMPSVPSVPSVPSMPSVTAIPKSTPIPSAPSIPKTSKPAPPVEDRKKFYEGSINWKFSDVNPNNDCWVNWDYVTGSGEVIESQIKRSLKRKDGREWCAVDKATPNSYRREFDEVEPHSVLDTVNEYTGNIWGLTGAIGLGMTEELVHRAIAKSAELSAKRAAKKAAETASRELLKRATKELNEELGQQVSKKIGQRADESAKRALTNVKKLRKEFGDKLSQAVANKFDSKVLSKLRNKTAAELRQGLIEKFGKKSMTSIRDDIMKKLANTITSKNLTISTTAVKNLLKQRLSSLSATYAKTISVTLQKKLLSKLSLEVQKAAAARLYRAIISKVTSSVTNYVTRTIAKAIVLKAILKAKLVAIARTFFQLQAKLFASIGKALSAGANLNAAKIAAKLTALAKSIGKQSIKSAFKTGLSTAAKIASKLKPGPLTIFDILSTALDAADPLKYNAFMTSKDFREAAIKSDLDRKNLFITELLKSDSFKDSGLTAEDIEYPTKLDPTSDLPAADDEAAITAKIDILFKMAKVSEPHPCIAKFVDTMNTDLAANPSLDLDAAGVMDKYIDLMNIDAITTMVKIDNCMKVGGVVYDVDKCTYSKEACNKLYTWPLDSEKRPKDIYAEHRNGICVQGNPEIRSMCDTIGADWSSDLNTCLITKGYCFKKGGTWDPDTFECKIPLKQEIIEYIFGTTVTRFSKQAVETARVAIKSIFDTFLEGCGQDGEIKILGKCVDGGDLSSGVRLKIWDCNGSKAQQWYYSERDRTIRPIADQGKCLEATSGMIHLSPLKLMDCVKDSKSQKFTYDDQTGEIKGYYNPSVCADLDNINTSNGTTFNMIQCKRNDAQKFAMKRNEITDMGATCYVDSSRPADCPDSYTNNGLTCGRGGDEAFKDSGRPADCPEGYTNNGLTCGRSAQSKTSDFGLGIYETADCPDDYTNTGTTCYYWGSSFERDYFSRAFSSIESDKRRCEEKYGSGKCEIVGVTGSRLARPSCETEARYLGKRFPEKYSGDGLNTMGARCHRVANTLGTISDKGVCPPSNDSKNMYTTKTGGLCYVNCEKAYGPGWYNNGTSCWKDVSTLGTDSMTCRDGEFLNPTTGRCYKKCAEVYGDEYMHNGVSCYRLASTLGEGSMTCKPWERYVLGRCYPKVFHDMTDAGLVQSRTKDQRKDVLAGISAQVNLAVDAIRPDTQMTEEQKAALYTATRG